MKKNVMNGRVIENAIAKANMTENGGPVIFTGQESNRLYDLIEQSMKNYKEHYGEKPTPEIISDILGIPVDFARDAMEYIEAANGKSL